MRKWTYLVAALLMSGTAATFTTHERNSCNFHKLY